MTSIYVPTEAGVRMATRGHLVDADGERMTAWAEKFVHKDRDIAWLLGNFVEADNPNGNGHIFPLKDLQEESIKSVPNKPLNMLHHENYIVGAYAGAEMLYPTGEETASADGEPPMENPYMEALAGMWRFIYPDEYRLIEKAQKEGQLFFSMEASAETLTFVDYDVTVPYRGRQHESYPTQDLKAKRILNKPHFSGGAIIIPPVRPGWSRADITSMDSFIKEHPGVADAVFAGLQTEFPHLSTEQWERMMSQLVALARTE